MRPLLSALLGVALLASPASAASRDAAAELIASWLDVQEDDPAAWGQAWLEEESVHSRELDQSFYATVKPGEKRALVDQALATEMPRFSERMQQLSELQDHWAADVAAVQSAMSKEFGPTPAIDTYLFFAMSPQKAVACRIDGKPSVAVNARMLLPYQGDATRLLLTKALLVHVASGWARERADGNTPSVAAQLQAEGLVAWAAGRVVPAVPVSAILSVTGTQAATLEKAKGAIAREMLAALDSGAPVQLDRFFGAKPPEGWPPASGRYVGWLVAREVASELGGPAIVRMSRKSYTARARSVLKRLAAGLPN